MNREGERLEGGGHMRRKARGHGEDAWVSIGLSQVYAEIRWSAAVREGCN